MTWAAIVLAGGRGSRLGGVDKPALVVGGMTLLDRVVAAVDGADPVVVVGPQRPTARPVVWTRETEPGAGPVAALAAGLSAVTAEVVVLLAADLPAVDGAAVRAVREAVDATGAVLVDAEGRDQWLFSAWRTDVLRAAVARPGRGLYAILGPLDPVRVPDTAGASSDLDTPADLDRWR
ncbi:molybdenum cofactor guanylyltransferase [Actinokineospora sp. NPDC004072]